MTHQPFIDDAGHLATLEGQRFVVLRAPPALEEAFGPVQRALRLRLAALPVSFPARPHVTLCGFASGTSLDAVQRLTRSWAGSVPRLRLETERVASFPSPFQVVIVQLRKTPALFEALASLRARAREQRLVISTDLPLDQWTFHLSAAYCDRLGPEAWRDLTTFLGTLEVPRVESMVDEAEVVAFNAGREDAGGVHPFTGHAIL